MFTDVVCLSDLTACLMSWFHFITLPVMRGFLASSAFPEHLTGGAAVGDYDGDGLEDIYFTVSHDSSVLYRNNGEHWN